MINNITIRPIALNLTDKEYLILEMVQGIHIETGISK